MAAYKDQEKEKQYQREYHRKWREKNPEKVRQYYLKTQARLKVFKLPNKRLCIGKIYLSSYQREKLLKDPGKCQHCGNDDPRVLLIHHTDRNRKNNIRENLLLLCWNCHVIEHWTKGDGMFHRRHK